MIIKKTNDTLKRSETAIKDKNFDCIRNLHVCETRPEHFDRALAGGKVSTNECRLQSIFGEEFNAALVAPLITAE